MVSTWMGFAPEIIRNAGGNEFVTQTQNRNETHDSNIDGGLKEHLTLTQKLTLGQGRGRIVFDVLMTSAAVLSMQQPGSRSHGARRPGTATSRSTPVRT